MPGPAWFLGQCEPKRDGHPSYAEALANMPPIADSCYRPRRPEPAQPKPEPDAQSQD